MRIPHTHTHTHTENRLNRVESREKNIPFLWILCVCVCRESYHSTKKDFQPDNISVFLLCCIHFIIRSSKQKKLHLQQMIDITSFMKKVERKFVRYQPHYHLNDINRPTNKKKGIDDNQFSFIHS